MNKLNICCVLILLLCVSGPVYSDTSNAKNKSYTQALDKMLKVELKRLQLTEQGLSQEERHNIVLTIHGSSLKLYSRFMLLDYVAELCAPHLAPKKLDIKSALENYRVAMKDELIIGEHVYKTGYSVPERKINITPEELGRKVIAMKEIQKKTFTVHEGNSKKYVERECEKQMQFMKSGTKLQM